MRLLEAVELNKISITENLRENNWEKDIEELAKSIKSVGLLQPPTLRSVNNGYTVIYGARRVAACKLLKLKTIPAIVIDEEDTKEIWPKRLAENITRKNLQPLEEALVLKKIKEELKLTSKTIADAIGVTEGYVCQRLQLLTLPKEIQEALQKGRIDFTHARHLARVVDAKEQKKLLRIAEKFSPAHFQEKLRAAKKRKTQRGRPRKQNTPRSITEIKKAAAEIDKELVKATEDKNTLREEFLKGMLRGLGWAGGFISAPLL